MEWNPGAMLCRPTTRVQWSRTPLKTTCSKHLKSVLFRLVIPVDFLVVLVWSLQLQLKRNRQQPKVKRKMGGRAGGQEGGHAELPTDKRRGKGTQRDGGGRHGAAPRSKRIFNALRLQCSLFTPNAMSGGNTGTHDTYSYFSNSLKVGEQNE